MVILGATLALALALTQVSSAAALAPEHVDGPHASSDRSEPLRKSAQDLVESALARAGVGPGQVGPQPRIVAQEFPVPPLPTLTPVPRPALAPAAPSPESAPAPPPTPVPPPQAPFQEFWVQNHTIASLWSGPDDQAVSFGPASQWEYFKVVEPQVGSRLHVLVAATNNFAWIDAQSVGPSGPAPIPPGVKADRPLRVGVQAGHWQTELAPLELSFLWKSTGASVGDKTEVQVNLDVARRVARLLEAAGLQVDVLPTGIPHGYRADVFVSVHADGGGPTRRGFKIARPAETKDPARDDRLVQMLDLEYERATGLARDYENVTANMRYYYAFGRLAADVPAAIVEMGFMTTPLELKLMTEEAHRPAEGIARGILRFLGVLSD